MSRNVTLVNNLKKQAQINGYLIILCKLLFQLFYPHKVHTSIHNTVTSCKSNDNHTTPQVNKIDIKKKNSTPS